MEYYDYNNTDPNTTLTTTYNKFHIYYSESGGIGTSTDPKLEITLDTGYGHSVIGVASANIGKINGVATGDIEKVNGVD